MENIEINLDGKVYKFIPPPTTSTIYTTPSFVGHSATLGTTSPWTFEERLPEYDLDLFTYSKDEVLNKLLNEMADEVAGIVRGGIDLNIDSEFKPYWAFTSTSTPTWGNPVITSVSSSPTFELKASSGMSIYNIK